MASGCWKRAGRSICGTVIGIMLFSTAGGAVELETVIGSSTAGVGEPVELQIKISGSGSADPVSIPRVDGLDIVYSGQSTSFQFINGKTFRGIILSFRITANRSGRFTIPSFVIKVNDERHKSTPCTLTAVKGVREKEDGGRALLATEITISKKSCYAGEPLILRYFYLHKGVEISERPMFERRPLNKGFIIKDIEETVEDSLVTRGGIEYVRSHMATMIAIPAEQGNFSVGDVSAVLAVAVRDDFFSFPRRQRIMFDAVDVRVLPLPESGTSAAFQGNVGSYAMAVEQHQDANGVLGRYDEMRITVKISGSGNFISFVRPAFASEHHGVRVITTEDNKTMRVEKDTLQGTVRYLFTVIPERSGRIDLGPIALGFFNPHSGRYETRQSMPIILQVKNDQRHKGDVAFDDEKNGNRLEINALIIAGIIFMVIGIVVLVLVWERKKYRLLMQRQNTPKHTPEIKPHINQSIDIDTVSTAVRLGDIEEFLRSAESLVRRIESQQRNGHYHADPQWHSRFRDFKNQLYGYKYGGGMPAGEVQRLFELIKGLYTEITKN